MAHMGQDPSQFIQLLPRNFVLVDPSEEMMENASRELGCVVSICNLRSDQSTSRRRDLWQHCSRLGEEGRNGEIKAIRKVMKGMGRLCTSEISANEEDAENILSSPTLAKRLVQEDFFQPLCDPQELLEERQNLIAQRSREFAKAVDGMKTQLMLF